MVLVSGAQPLAGSFNLAHFSLGETFQQVTCFLHISFLKVIFIEIFFEIVVDLQTVIRNNIERSYALFTQFPTTRILTVI